MRLVVVGHLCIRAGRNGDLLLPMVVEVLMVVLVVMVELAQVVGLVLLLLVGRRRGRHIGRMTLIWRQARRVALLVLQDGVRGHRLLLVIAGRLDHIHMVFNLLVGDVIWLRWDQLDRGWHGGPRRRSLLAGGHLATSDYLLLGRFRVAFLVKGQVVGARERLDAKFAFEGSVTSVLPFVAR